jgi:hypothetical protein
MGQTAILFPHGAKPETAWTWQKRAAQARRIAPMLAPKDAEILEAFARECEAKAAKPVSVRPIAA